MVCEHRSQLWMFDARRPKEGTMFRQIMTPVDLGKLETMGMALQCAADLARQHSCGVCYVGATTPQPGPLGHTPQEYEARLKDFAQSQAATHGHDASHKMMIAHDPVTDLDDVLLKAVSETGADLVVMATHKPGVVEYIWPSNGGKLASHADASVFLVRG